MKPAGAVQGRYDLLHRLIKPAGSGRKRPPPAGAPAGGGPPIDGGGIHDAEAEYLGACSATTNHFTSSTQSSVLPSWPKPERAEETAKYSSSNRWMKM